eukprot:8346403-Pyramimonas_sp.AAC.1
MLLFQLKERGNAFFQRKQYDQALEWYTKAIAEDGSVHAVYTNRAATYFNLGKESLQIPLSGLITPETTVPLVST